MATASNIIKQLGGNKAVADWLKLERSAVQRWTYEPPRGSGNCVPMKHWAALMQLGAHLGKPLALEELMPAAVVEAAELPRKRQKPLTGAAA